MIVSGGRRAALATAVAAVLVFAPMMGSAAVAAPTMERTQTHASVVQKKPVVKTFKNCTELNKVHRGSVAKAGVTGNMVKGKKKPFTVKPTVSTPLYKANQKMDRDKDGIACEKG
ncbi:MULTISPECIES: excalibur calcium-binding domain-containing protein [unclassified Microbacterium]|uniref:excalibur calcium-binding domain-containing protein n=1 Tax=unclassified Microbacterium TaxID=2609290 RepID=UPI00200596A5|nr:MULTISPECIES: excalibur calcium-binding domain-containing protein [unclassified Microbacterium]